MGDVRPVVTRTPFRLSVCMSRRRLKELPPLPTPPTPQETVWAPVERAGAGLFVTMTHKLEGLAPFLPVIRYPARWDDPTFGCAPFPQLDPPDVPPHRGFLREWGEERRSSEESKRLRVAAYRAANLETYGPSRFDEQGDPWIMHRHDLHEWLQTASPTALVRVVANPFRGLVFGTHPALAIASRAPDLQIDRWREFPMGHAPWDGYHPEAAMKKESTPILPWERSQLSITRPMRCNEWVSELPTLSPALLLALWREMPPANWGLFLDRVLKRIHAVPSELKRDRAWGEIHAVLGLIVLTWLHRPRLAQMFERGPAAEATLQYLAAQPDTQTPAWAAWRGDMLSALLLDAPTQMPRSEQAALASGRCGALRSATFLVLTTHPAPRAEDVRRVESAWRAHQRSADVFFSSECAVSQILDTTGPATVHALSPWAQQWLTLPRRGLQRGLLGPAPWDLQHAVLVGPSGLPVAAGRWRRHVMATHFGFRVGQVPEEGFAATVGQYGPLMGHPDGIDEASNAAGLALVVAACATPSARRTAQVLRRHLTAVTGQTTVAAVLSHRWFGPRAHQIIAAFPDDVVRALGRSIWSCLLRSSDKSWRLYWLGRLADASLHGPNAADAQTVAPEAGAREAGQRPRDSGGRSRRG